MFQEVFEVARGMLQEELVDESVLSVSLITHLNLFLKIVCCSIQPMATKAIAD
jgi:hypothetical protein